MALTRKQYWTEMAWGLNKFILPVLVAMEEERKKAEQFTGSSSVAEQGKDNAETRVRFPARRTKINKA